MKEFIGIYIVFSFLAHLFFVVLNGEFLPYYPKASFLEKFTHWYIFLTPVTFLLTVPLVIVLSSIGIITGWIWLFSYFLTNAISIWRRSRDNL